ncbi:MAG: ABC transporter permease [Chloroflexi bacterium]|nr:ABC transporter permease [Chloroflexota bacterium]
MNKTLAVLRFELITIFTRKSFLFLAFGMPIITFLIFQVVGAINRNDPNAIDDIIGSSQGVDSDGFVDLGGLITTHTEEIENGMLVPFTDEASASQALDAGEIVGYYLIPENVSESGKLIYIRPDFNPLALEDKAWAIEILVLTNLLGGDIEMAQRVWVPMDLEVTLLAPPKQQRDDSSPITFLIPYITTMIFYMVILGSASLLLNSIAKEKQNRVMEVLMLSISPREMLTGKIIGLGIAGLTQTLIWTSLGYILLKLSGRSMSLPPGLELPVSILVWGLVFFLLGYAIYGSLMAGLGALVPNIKEATQATIVVIFPLIIPMILQSALIEKPFDPPAIILSIFPLTAPVAMMTRLAGGGVPLWQPFLAAGLMLLTALIVIRAVVRLFHAQTILSGQPFKVGRFVKAIVRGV